MASTDRFPDPSLQDIVAELADWLIASELPTEGTTIASVPLSIWDLGGATSLRDDASPTDEWHHQIRHHGRAIAFARSRVIGDHAELVELAESPLAAALESVFAALRGGAEDSTILRLLRIQRNHTTCLWLYQPDGDDEVITLESPLWGTGIRLDEATFLRMASVLPGPGLVVAHGGPRRENFDPWNRSSWPISRRLPVRQPTSGI